MDNLNAFSYEGFEYEPSLGALGPMGRFACLVANINQLLFHTKNRSI